MKNYSIMTVIAQLPAFNNLTPGQAIPIAVSLPNNAIPLQVDYRPGMGNTPASCAVHYLVPCDDKGNPMDEVITPLLYETAWVELYKCFSERMQQEELDLMDSVFTGIALELKDEEGVKQENGG